MNDPSNGRPCTTTMLKLGHPVSEYQYQGIWRGDGLAYRSMVNNEGGYESESELEETVRQRKYTQVRGSGH